MSRASEVIAIERTRELLFSRGYSPDDVIIEKVMPQGHSFMYKVYYSIHNTKIKGYTVIDIGRSRVLVSEEVDESDDYVSEHDKQRAIDKLMSNTMYAGYVRVGTNFKVDKISSDVFKVSFLYDGCPLSMHAILDEDGVGEKSTYNSIW